MTRALETATADELSAAVIRPILLFEGEFASGTARAWSGYGNFIWNGYTFQGVGSFGGVSGIEEVDGIKAGGITVQLSGIPAENLSLALSETRQNQDGTVYLALLSDEVFLATEAGEIIGGEDGASFLSVTHIGEFIGAPYAAFVGRLDVPEIEEGAETGVIRITYENRLIDLERARERRYTKEDQAIDYPEDLGFDFVPELQDKVLLWGRS